MPLEKEKPPTHTAWSQFRGHGKFRDWYKRGPAWVQRILDGPGQHGAKHDPDTCPHCGAMLPPISGKVFHAMHGPRGDDGFTYFFPIGMEPPPPPEPQPKRPGSSGEDGKIMLNLLDD
jgi:hypothetical protein